MLRNWEMNAQQDMEWKQDVVRRRKEREIRDMKGAPGIYVHCVARKREGLALVSVARAEP
jgi:hypothetical protein